MNPASTIEIGSRVVVRKTVISHKSNIGPNHVGKMFTIRDIEWGGRAHNRYISSVILQSADGARFRGVIDQLSSVNPNYEPMGDIIVCVSCSATLYEENLVLVKGTKLKACPFCKTIEPTVS